MNCYAWPQATCLTTDHAYWLHVLAGGTHTYIF